MLTDEFSEIHVEDVYDVVTHSELGSDAEYHVISKGVRASKEKKVEGLVKLCGVEYAGTARCLNECEQKLEVEAQLRQELFETQKKLKELQVKQDKMKIILQASKLFERRRGRISLKFQPGVLGLNLSVQTGKVCKITGDQAISMGVQEGWQMIELNNEEYSESLLAEYRQGSEPYLITFATENTVPQDNTEDYNSFETIIADLQSLYHDSS